MIQDQFSFSAFNFSSKLIRALVNEEDAVKPFLPTFFSIDQLSEQARIKKLNIAQRKVLVEQLQKQNESLDLSEKSKVNIEALQSENAVTITTGHQLNLLTGPLYSIYKVAQVISLCKIMNEKDAAFRYIPVFWMATEDHDFDEINHIYLFGNKISWEKENQQDKIVGEIIPAGIASFLDQITDKYKDEALRKELEKFTEIYQQSTSLAAATRSIMNALFKEYGLVIIDGNDAQLKTAFAPIAQKEIEEEFVYNAVSATNKSLENSGFHQQVFVRECNLFHIDTNGIRTRIAKTEGGFTMGDKLWTKEELTKEIATNPVQFSPNALLRPVYQEAILPNIAYIGGGGEIAYWLQLSGVFEALNLTFPLLRVRDSLVLLRGGDLNDLEELNYQITDLKRNYHDLLKEIALDDVEITIELSQEEKDLDAIKNKILEKSTEVNKGLAPMIEAEFTKMQSSIDRIASKLVKAEKAKHERKGKKIKKLQAKIYPDGGFQERYENFLPYFLSDRTFVSKIVDTLTAEDQPKIRIVEI